MDKDEVPQTNKNSSNLSTDEIKRLTNFFEILIRIDQRERKKQCKK